MSQQREKATPAQIARITGMLASGLIDKPGAQRIIESHRAPRQGSAKREVLLARKFAFWEKRYPGKGAALMEVLGSFYGRTLNLRPAIPNLEQLAKEAYFWAPIEAVRIVPLSEGGDFIFNGNDSIDAEVHYLTLSSDADRFAESWLLGHGCPEVDELFGSVCATDGASGVFHLLEDSFNHVLGAACAHAIAGHAETARRQLLLRLYLEGNFPFADKSVFFGSPGILHILVAD